MNFNTKAFSLAALLISSVGFSLSASAASYYLSPSGSDSNPGTSTSKPWKTLDRLATAQSILRPGDTVYFRGGTYLINDNSKNNYLFLSAKGTSSARITYKRYASEVPVILYDRRVIDGGKGHQVAIYPGDYTTFDGLTIKQSEDSRCLALNSDCLTRSETTSATDRYYSKSVRAT